MTAAKIAALTITGDKIAANAISADKIAANAVTASEIASGAVTTDKLSANAVTAGTIASGAVTTDKLAALAVTAAKIAALTITGDKIAANAISADKITSNAVTADKLAANSVNASKIVSGAITADKLAANSVTAVKIAAGSITTDKIKAGQFQGYVFTGAIYQSSTAENTGFKLRDAGLDMWDSEHNHTVHLDGNGATNVVTGRFKTAFDGARIEFSTATVDDPQMGEIYTGAIDFHDSEGLVGQLYATSSGSGIGLIKIQPAGSQIAQMTVQRYSSSLTSEVGTTISANDGTGKTASVGANVLPTPSIGMNGALGKNGTFSWFQWKALDAGFGVHSYAHGTVNAMPLRYGRYYAWANADCNWAGIVAHVENTGGTSGWGRRLLELRHQHRGRGHLLHDHGHQRQLGKETPDGYENREREPDPRRGKRQHAHPAGRARRVETARRLHGRRRIRSRDPRPQGSRHVSGRVHRVHPRLPGARPAGPARP